MRLVLATARNIVRNVERVNGTLKVKVFRNRQSSYHHFQNIFAYFVSRYLVGFFSLCLSFSLSLWLCVCLSSFIVSHKFVRFFCAIVQHICISLFIVVIQIVFKSSIFFFKSLDLYLRRKTRTEEMICCLLLV